MIQTTTEGVHTRPMHEHMVTEDPYMAHQEPQFPAPHREAPVTAKGPKARITARKIGLIQAKVDKAYKLNQDAHSDLLELSEGKNSGIAASLRDWGCDTSAAIALAKLPQQLGDLIVTLEDL